jgi:hypothetical protein
MTYRREAILDALAKAEETGDESIAETAKSEWAIEHTSLSVCMAEAEAGARSSTQQLPRRHCCPSLSRGMAKKRTVNYVSKNKLYV